MVSHTRSLMFTLFTFDVNLVHIIARRPN
jgi:hypothetical protein